MIATDEVRENLQEELERRVSEVNDLMQTHAGAIEVASVSPEGVVTVRFVAMCQGCPFRSVTMYSLIKPALEEVPGVTEVLVEGVRISEEAARRASAALGDGAAWYSLSRHGRQLHVV